MSKTIRTIKGWLWMFEFLKKIVILGNLKKII